jgi:RNA polymerase sporulation-specific sigma factor
MNQKQFRELLIKARSGDNESKAKIVNENIPLVWSLVHRFKNTLYDKEDLFQIGCLALLKAIDKFNTDYDVQFSTYAVPIILGELKRHFRDDGAIKVSRSLKELNIRINKAKEELHLKLGKEPSIQELSKYLNEPMEDVVMAIEANFYPTSLNEVVYEKDGSTINMEDRIIDDRSEKLINLSIHIHMYAYLLYPHVVNNVVRRHIQIPVYSQTQETIYFGKWQAGCGCCYNR